MKRMFGWILRRLNFHRPLKSTLFCARLLICAVACSLSADGQDKVSPAKPVPVTPLIVTIGTYPNRITNSALLDRERVVIRDRATWENMWTRIGLPRATIDPKTGRFQEIHDPLPEIDFAQEMLVVVAMGQRPSSGYSITVEGAKDFADRIEVEVRSISPKGCIVFTMMTSPIDIVRVPRTDKTVVFHETEVVKDCK